MGTQGVEDFDLGQEVVFDAEDLDLVRIPANLITHSEGK